jgi:tetratricopeptide (TPR) repeat protein
MRNRIIILLFVTCLTGTGIVSAQATKLQQGKTQFDNGFYIKAMEYFNQAISQERSMTPEMLTEAYYYRGLTYMRLYNEAYSGDDKDEQKLYKDAILYAYRDYKASLSHDNGDLWKKIDLEMKNLHHPLLQEGLASLNEYNDLVFNGKTDPENLARAEDYLLAAHEIRESYLVCDLLGQVYLDKGQKQEAAGYFSKSEKLYTEKLPDEPDFLMAYVFYRLAAIHKAEDIKLALQDDQRGLNFMESEHSRFLAMKDKMTPEKSQQMEGQFNLALKDLNDLRLDLYLSDTAEYVTALHVFEQELSEKPDDVEVLIGYASLLEKSDKEKAILTYGKALELAPDNAIILFNLGALYYGKGKDLVAAAQDTKDDKQFDILMEGAKSEFETARPYFEKALVKEPDSQEIIRALKTIAFVLDDQPAYLKYKDMENKPGK